MGANAKRVKGKLVIEYQVTENRERLVLESISTMVMAINLQPYPHEWVNPAKGDFVLLKEGKSHAVK